MLIICLLFIWLWVTVLLMSSMFAILDGIKYYGFNIAFIWSRFIIIDNCYIGK
ncbi:MAG: hypothetical protein L6V81_09460 [Clostridium sp.]|nr:MAG: hypothetical protein L6V81_09460 [Clostridium sp.]